MDRVLPVTNSLLNPFPITVTASKSSLHMGKIYTLSSLGSINSWEKRINSSSLFFSISPRKTDFCTRYKPNCSISLMIFLRLLGPLFLLAISYITHIFMFVCVRPCSSVAILFLYQQGIGKAMAKRLDGIFLAHVLVAEPHNGIHGFFPFLEKQPLAFFI